MTRFSTRRTVAPIGPGLLALCLARPQCQQPEREGLAGVVCGVENADRIAEAWCSFVGPYCDVITPCCNDAAYPTTRAACEAATRAECGEAVRQYLEGGACFDADLHDPSCDASYNEFLRDCRVVPIYGQAYREHAARCPQVWRSGARRPGDACQRNLQCSSTDPVAISVCGAGGSCESRELHAAGEPCQVAGAVCEVGTTCDPTREVCVTVGTAGDACESVYECASGSCDSSGTCLGYGTDCSGGCGWGVCEDPRDLPEDQPRVSIDDDPSLGECRPPPLALSLFCQF